MRIDVVRPMTMNGYTCAFSSPPAHSLKAFACAIVR